MDTKLKHGHTKSRKKASHGKTEYPPCQEDIQLPASIHRDILFYLNDAVRAEDLMYGKPSTLHIHPKDHPEHHTHKREALIDHDTASDIMQLREKAFPLGFRHINDLRVLRRFNFELLDRLIFPFSARVRGQWQEFPIDIPRRGNGTMDGVVHAALLKKSAGNNGRVLFITADQTTLLWDPEDTTASTFSDPANQPHTMPDGYSQLCGHHVQLADGKLLCVGGGGYSPNSQANAGYIFDPDTNSWERTANNMSEPKWYPTAVSLGGNKVLIVSGHLGNKGQMDLYDETTKTFQPVSGDDKGFPNLYPGLHLLPNNSIFYSRTGFGTAGAGPGGTAFDNPTDSPDVLGGKRPAYFELNTHTHSGSWQKITPSPIRRVKGMSVMLLSNTAPFVRIMVLGGNDSSTNDTYEILDASTMSPTASFAPAEPFPDGENRSLASGVLLPDGNLFVCGGIRRNNSPCTLYNSKTDSWSAMANLPSIRDYHSTAILLPSGKVMMAGWHNTKIELYSPPYLFKGARPVISHAPEMVHHGADFTIESPDAAEISRIVMVRPMAVTHQTDSEQRVIELPYVHDHDNPTQLTMTAPDGGHPHPIAPRGHYMLFALNTDGVPSIAEWIFLH